jgi:hypothetical protein
VASAHHRSGLLTEKAREIFTAQAAKGLPEIAKAILKKMSDLLSLPASAEQTQERRDAWLAFRSAGKNWVNSTHKAWRLACEESPQSIGIRRDIESGKFELMDNSVMENRIIASRLGLGILDVVSWELNDLRLRVQSLDNLSALELNDIFKPEVLARKMIEQWTSTGLSRETWLSAQDVIENCMAEHLLEAYHTTNEFLVQHGVMAEIDLRPWVKRSSVGSLSPIKPEAFKDSGADGGVRGDEGIDHGHAVSSAGGTASAVLDAGGGSGAYHRSGQSALEETRIQAGTTPLARGKMRAQGVMGGLMQLLSKQVADFDKTHGLQASPQLAQALAKIWSGDSSQHPAQVAQTDGLMYGAEHIEQASALLRQRTRSLKKAAATSAEKASIEIVALMFQSILAEDRISAAVRVWFARLQMPVLRVAISEPEFFGSLQHPARRLIDRMGSCVLGFEIDVSGGAMELEIKRIVQVVEQYPETGRRVFQLVDSEFQNFLSRFLSQKGRAAHVVSIAQQVEQKETMTIQYTIEMRNTLIQMPVHDKIRAFLFKTWAEVLAIAAMRHGPQHEKTLTLKRCASDLVWAASAKPNRTDRSQVITDLPKLLQVLRMGMRMLGMDVKTQDENINLISDTLADAFMSKTAAISSERLAAMANRLTHLEDFLSDADVGDLPLDTEALVLMIGIDASDIEVVTDGDSQPAEAMRLWALELQLGSWFSLDHNGRSSHVQFAWRSDRKQLHLFASADGQNFLIQTRRLAAYLQAGLLLPAEQDALTVRATRDALAKLEANPERLLD